MQAIDPLKINIFDIGWLDKVVTTKATQNIHEEVSQDVIVKVQDSIKKLMLVAKSIVYFVWIKLFYKRLFDAILDHKVLSTFLKNK